MRQIDADELLEEIKSLKIMIGGMRSGREITTKYLEEYKKSILRIIDEQPTIFTISDFHRLMDFVRMIDNMKHCLGIDVTEMRKGEKTYKCYRNYFCGYEKSLETAVELEFATKEERKEELIGEVIYHITERGRNLLSNILGIKIVEVENNE